MENELFEKTKVSKAYMTLALPVVLGMVVSLIYNMVDTFFIARTGNTALIAGVSLGTPIFTLMIALGDIFGVGGSSVISRLFGKKEYEDGRRISVFCFYAAIAVGIVVSIILLAAKQPILGLLGCDETTWQYAGDYYQWIALGAPFIIVQLTPNNLVRTEGFAKASMIGTMIGAVVNITLDPVFIYTLGLGAAGAAIATVLGNICGDIFYVIFIIKKCRYLSVDFRKLKVTGAEVLAVLAIGIPASVTNFMQSIGVTLTNRFLQPYGTDKVAAMGIALKIIMISVLVMVGFAFGGQPLVGYNYGAKNKKRFNETIRFAFLLEVLTGAGMAIVLGAAAPLQEAAVTGLRFGDEYYDDLREKYTAKRDLFIKGLNDIGIKHTVPQGAYYVMLDISEFGFESDLEFCDVLARDVGVGAVPGSSFFREPVNSLIRLHFAKKDETLYEALNRLSDIRKKIPKR